MPFLIRYTMRTGDSFSTEIVTNELEYEFDDIKYAEETLKRIQEHYEWYEDVEDYRISKKKANQKKPSWHNVKYANETILHHIINIRVNEDETYQFHCPWCGCFEKLIDVEIVVKKEE